MTQEEIRVLYKPVDGLWRFRTIKNTLKDLQEAVGGYIETLAITSGLTIICNEEGRLRGLPYNCTLCGEDFVGNILIARVDGENFAGLTEWQIRVLRDLFDLEDEE